VRPRRVSDPTGTSGNLPPRCCAVCPLTTLEMALRLRAGSGVYEGSFIQHWLQRLLYYEAPGWVFALAYTLFGLLVVIAWWYFPPTLRRRSRGGD